MGVLRIDPSEAIDLVQLTELDRSTWTGRAVLCPWMQVGGEAAWLFEVYPESFPQSVRTPKGDLVADDLFPDIGDPYYDVGFILGHEDNPSFGVADVFSVCSNGSIRKYAANNLWTPVLDIDRETDQSHGPAKPG